MKNISLTGLIFVLIFGLGCTKYKDLNQELYGDGYIRGRIYLADSFLSDQPLEVGSGIKVFLSTEPEGENYLISQATDSEGYFVFKDINKGKKDEKKTYYIYSSYQKDSISYIGRMMVSPDTSGIFLLLRPDTQTQSALTFIVNDSLGNRISGCHVCIFNNLLSVPDTGCNGSTWTDTTNLKGEVRIRNLPTGTYKVNFSYYDGSGAWYRQISVDVPSTGFLYRTITITPNIKPIVNKISYYLMDSLGGSIPGTQVCAFSSFVLANDSCLGNNWLITSDSTGAATIQNVAPGNYKVFFKVESGSVILKGIDTIWGLGSITQYLDTIILKQ